MITQYDHLEIRCPTLGHPLSFSYCRTTDGDKPCRRIYNCWFQRIPIEKYMQTYFPKETIDNIVAPPKPKMLSLVELIEKARQTKKNGDIPQDDIQL